MLQSTLRSPAAAREHSHPPVAPSTLDSQIDDTPAEAPALLPPETKVSCARITDHEWHWHAEPSVEHRGRNRYVMRCRLCQTVGAHVDNA